MSRKFGVSLDEDVAKAVEEPLEFGDSRSERIEQLISAGLAVEAALERDDYAVSFDEPREVQAFVRTVFDDYEE